MYEYWDTEKKPEEGRGETLKTCAKIFKECGWGIYEKSFKSKSSRFGGFFKRYG
jgi:hypothetical protein